MTGPQVKQDMERQLHPFTSMHADVSTDVAVVVSSTCSDCTRVAGISLKKALNGRDAYQADRFADPFWL
jgi:hypothetical protein